MGRLRSPHGLFTGCLRSLNPYRARKLIMHALKLYGPHTGRQNSYSAARGPYRSHGWTYDFCSKQPGNSLYGAQECDVIGALHSNTCDSVTSANVLTHGQKIWNHNKLYISSMPFYALNTQSQSKHTHWSLVSLSSPRTAYSHLVLWGHSRTWEALKVLHNHGWLFMHVQISTVESRIIL